MIMSINFKQIAFFVAVCIMLIINVLYCQYFIGLKLGVCSLGTLTFKPANSQKAVFSLPVCSMGDNFIKYLHTYRYAATLSHLIFCTYNLHLTLWRQ